MAHPNNDTTDWDWIVWETEGNPDPKYQRGGTTRGLGLYSLNYDKLRKADQGETAWAPAHTDHTIGGGRVKIASLSEINYSAHRELIQAFLPCFTIDGSGRLVEPPEGGVSAVASTVSRAPSTSTVPNTINTPPPRIVMPFNYDDNSAASRAVGTSLTDVPLCLYDAARLQAELTRWASASRSSIAAFFPQPIALTPHATNAWTLRPNKADDSSLPQIAGPPNGLTLKEFQAVPQNQAVKYYSVKTGVQFVSTQNQKGNNKDLLESNSIHAMHRSGLIAGTQQRVGEGVLEAKYQIEILCILYGGRYDDDTGDLKLDGIQIRAVGDAAAGEVWFPALAIPSHGRAFAQAWNPTGDWVDLWDRSFAVPLGRAKAEMLCYFGMQHMTSNAQNFLVAFDPNGGATGKSKHVILRDIGDTLYNDYFFNVLKTLHNQYATEWAHESGDAVHGVTLAGEIGGGYAKPQMTRIGVHIVFFFPPFLKGDLDTDKTPSLATIVTRWSRSHNTAFLAYFREKVGYANDWNAGADSDMGDLPTRLRTFADMDNKTKAQYATLVPQVLALNSTQRWRLIREIEGELDTLAPANADDVTRAKKLVCAHEVLICAEVQGYIQSERGKAALKALHQGRPVAQVQQGQAVATGPACATCAKRSGGATVGWYKCATCPAHYCPTCAKKLRLPRDVSKRLQLVSSRYLCAAPCTGIVEESA